MHNRAFMKQIDTADIANMILLADGILFSARYGIFMYDENGIRLKGDDISEQLKKDKANGIDDDLILSILCSVHELTDATGLTPKEILEKLSPIKNRILGMFRNGGVPTDSIELDELCAAPSVSDDWLLELFAMRIRDRIISFVLQDMAADRAKKKPAEREDK